MSVSPDFSPPPSDQQLFNWLTLEDVAAMQTPLDPQTNSLICGQVFGAVHAYPQSGRAAIIADTMLDSVSRGGKFDMRTFVRIRPGEPRITQASKPADWLDLVNHIHRSKGVIPQMPLTREAITNTMVKSVGNAFLEVAKTSRRLAPALGIVLPAEFRDQKRVIGDTKPLTSDSLNRSFAFALQAYLSQNPELLAAVAATTKLQASHHRKTRAANHAAAIAVAKRRQAIGAYHTDDPV